MAESGYGVVWEGGVRQGRNWVMVKSPDGEAHWWSNYLMLRSDDGEIIRWQSGAMLKSKFSCMTG